MVPFDEGLAIEVVEGSLVVEVKVVAPLDELGVAAGEAADAEVVQVADLCVKLHFGLSSFNEASRRLCRRSATSSRNSCTSRSRFLSL